MTLMDDRTAAQQQVLMSSTLNAQPQAPAPLTTTRHWITLCSFCLFSFLLRTQCGCQCTRCCYQGNPANCTSVRSGTCPYDCLARNRTNCGVQFSTPRQSIFCAIPHTSAWPPILQVRGWGPERGSFQGGLVGRGVDRVWGLGV